MGQQVHDQGEKAEAQDRGHREGHDEQDQEVTRPRAIEISLADVPMKVRKPKKRT